MIERSKVIKVQLEKSIIVPNLLEFLTDYYWRSVEFHDPQGGGPQGRVSHREPRFAEGAAKGAAAKESSND